MKVQINVVVVVLAFHLQRHMTVGQKSSINIVPIGKTDTVIGNLLYQLGGIDDKTKELIDKEQNGPGRYELTLKTLQAQRKPLKFETSKYFISVIDPPERHFATAIASGADRIDCALLTVTAKTGEFKAGFSENGPIKIQTSLSYTLGIKQLIVAVNNMDLTEPKYSEDRFNEITAEVSKYLKNVGYNTKTIAFVPISDEDDDNIHKTSTKMTWFQGWEIERKEGKVTGKTLLEALNAIQPPPSPTETPLRIPLQDIYKVTGLGTVAQGRVETGIVKAGMSLTFAPTGLTAKVKSIEVFHEQVTEAGPGDDVSVNVENVGIRDLKRGYVAGDSGNNPPRKVKEFVAQIVIFNHPEIRTGYVPTVDCHTAHIACKFTELIEKIDPNTGKKEKKPDFLKSGDIAIVRMEPTKPMCVEPFSEFPALGRFAVRDGRSTVATGFVKEVTY